MKIIMIVYLFVSSLPSQDKMPVNSSLDTIFTFYLQVFDKYIENPKGDSSLLNMEAIQFFEIITSKYVRMPGNYIGKTHIEKDEVEYYKDWYKKNRRQLNSETIKKKLRDKHFYSRYDFINRIIDS